MKIISMEHISKGYGHRSLLSRTSFFLHDGDKAMLLRLGLEDFDAPACQLSGGQKKHAGGQNGALGVSGGADGENCPRKQPVAIRSKPDKKAEGRKGSGRNTGRNTDRNTGKFFLKCSSLKHILEKVVFLPLSSFSEGR